MEPVNGRIHSLESCGMVDGPGLRFVAFLQGCPLRCLYCHNPDSWNPRGGLQMSSLELVEEAWQYRTWMNSSGGGITLSGGEPLYQPEFVLDIIRRAHKKGMTVALDTSGFGCLEKTRECLDEADLILLDIKSPLPEAHKNLTGIRADQPRATLEYLKAIEKPLWIRHVVVPRPDRWRKESDGIKKDAAGNTLPPEIRVSSLSQNGRGKMGSGRALLYSQGYPVA